MPPTVSELLAEYCIDTPYDALPRELIASAKRLMLDTLAVAWAGSDAPGCGEARAVMMEEGGRAESTIWAYGGRVPASAAAFLNGTFAAALDYDSINTVHADMSVLPAALAVAEREHASGREFLAAYVLGADIACRLGNAMTAPPLGWFTSAIYGGFGAVAACARLLRLSSSQTAHAFGIQLTQASGTMQANLEQALSKRMMCAFGSRAGVLSALLAQRGVTAPREAFEGRFGLFNLYQPGDPHIAVKDLGTEFPYAKTAMKKYPSCACNHAVIEAALQLVREHDIAAADVTGAEAIISPLAHRLVGAPFEPRDNPQVTAQFSVQYSVACAILRRRLGVADIEEASVLDPAVGALARKVKVTIDDSMTHSRVPAEVRIVTAAGVLSRRVDRFPWGPDDPVTEHDFLVKFRDCASRGAVPMSPAQMERLISRVNAIENVQMQGLFAGVLNADTARHR